MGASLTDFDGVVATSRLLPVTYRRAICGYTPARPDVRLKKCWGGWGEKELDGYIIGFEELGIGDVDTVGGKNASLGEMIGKLAHLGVTVPVGFATTLRAFREYLAYQGLGARIEQRLQDLNVSDAASLAAAGTQIRGWVLASPFPPGFNQALDGAIQRLTAARPDMPLAVRSSAMVDELPEASLAQVACLNMQGPENVKQAVREVFASVFSDRAISYRSYHRIDQRHLALSAGVQQMVRSEAASSGVMFTLDTESGFRDVVVINASYGLGETVVQGAVNPDEFYVHKPTFVAGRPAILRRNLGTKTIKMIHADSGAVGRSVRTVSVDLDERARFSITDSEVLELTRQALVIEEHYQTPMDIEWAKDGDDGRLYIVQARPETVKSRQKSAVMERYILKETGKVLCEGRGIGQKIGSGEVRVVNNIADMHRVRSGDILVTDMTDADWEPVMKRAAAIVTDRGGRTCHAAIIAREWGIPAVVGCGDATEVLHDGQLATVSCAEGDTGLIYDGRLNFELRENSLESMPDLPFRIMMTIGNPDRAFDFQALPSQGVGLARLEFIINRMIGVHPKALLNFENLPRDFRQVVEKRVSGYASPVDFYVEKLVEGIATLAASFADKPVIVRLSDFKSNEYANLIAGTLYEPVEENPMLGFRGASRYISDSFRDCFELECRALKKVRDEMGFSNVEIMVPFVRTVGEAKQVVDLLAANGLKRGEGGLRIIMMCELPANAVLAEQFLPFFDGFSIGSNDLTQLILGLDRDSEIVAHLFDERNEAVLSILSMAIAACKRAGKTIGICGQGPSDHPDFARWLMDQGVDSISLNPDSVLKTWFYLAERHALHNGSGE